MRVIHVVDSGRASWSALAALASLQRINEQLDKAITVFALEGEAGRNRVSQAGVTPTVAAGSLRKTLPNADIVVAWDESAHASITRQAPTLDILRPSTPIPIRTQLIDRRPRQEIRSQLDLPSAFPVVALLCDKCDSQGLFTFASLLIAVSLAGFPSVGVAMNGAPDEKIIETMNLIGRGAKLVVRRYPPWTLMPACDCAIALEPIGTAGPTVRDLAKWASVAGAPVLAPDSHQADQDRQDTRLALRFVLSKQLLAALKSRPDPSAPAHHVMRTSDADFDRWLQCLVAQLEEAADHS